MLRELEVQELESLATNNPDLNVISKDVVYLIKCGAKLKVKEKLTRTSHSYVVYKYDNELYRYIVIGEYFV